MVGCHVRVEEEVVYYESRKREIKIRLMNEGRNDERPKDRVGEIHECDGRTHDPDTMVTPLTPKPTLKAETLVRVTTTIVSRREEDVALRKWP